MNLKKILIVSGTHGNEINPIWAVNLFNQQDNPNDRNLFPGDRLIHYEYLFGQSNNHTSNYYPTLQVYNLNITSERNEKKGDVLGEDIPFSNFYMPNQCWTDITMGIKKSATSR